MVHAGYIIDRFFWKVCDRKFLQNVARKITGIRASDHTCPLYRIRPDRTVPDRMKSCFLASRPDRTIFVRYPVFTGFTVYGYRKSLSGKVVFKNTFLSVKISITTLKSLIWPNISHKNLMWMLCTCFQYVFWVQNVQGDRFKMWPNRIKNRNIYANSRITRAWIYEENVHFKAKNLGHIFSVYENQKCEFLIL